MNTLEYLLKLQTGAFTGPLKSARDEQGRFIAQGREIGKNASQVNALGGAFSGLWSKISLAAGAAGVFAGLMAGLKKSISSAADMESTSVAFETLIGDVDLAATTIKRLKKLGAETPFEFPELANAGRMLIAFGESADSVTSTLRRVGDVASGVQAPIGEIAEIYGKARVQGTLFAEDINQLTGRGIPVIQEFAKQLGVSDGEVKNLAADGKITFPMLERAFQSLTGQGGRFFNMMQKQSGTMNGLWSTLKDGIGEIFTLLGQPINDSLKPWLQKAIGVVGQVSAVISQSIAQGKIGESIYHAFQLGRKMGFNAIIEGFRQLPGYLMGSLEKLAKIISAAIAGDIDMAKSIWKSVMDGSFKLDTSEHENYFKKLIEGAGGVKDAADEAKLSIMDVGAAADKAANKTKGDEKTGRKKIKGFSYRESGANAGFGGLDEFYAMQNAKELGIGVGTMGRFRGGKFDRKLQKSELDVRNAFGSGVFKMPKEVAEAMQTKAPAEGDATAPKGMKKTYMGGGLDEFHARNKTKGYAPAFTPQVPSPGTAKRSQERREAAATQARTSSSGHPLAASLKAMEAKLNTLALAT